MFVLIIIFTLILPSIANAASHTPLLFLVTTPSLFWGLFLTIPLEGFLYHKIAGVTKASAFNDSFATNILSTIIVGFLFPFIITFLCSIGAEFGGTIWRILGTFSDGSRQQNLEAVIPIIFWIFIMFILTVFCEAFILKKRWRSRKFLGKKDEIRTSLYCNAISYACLSLGIAFWASRGLNL